MPGDGRFHTVEPGGPAQPRQRLDELLGMVGFTSDDADRLARALPVLRPVLPDVAEAFYANILSSPQAHAVLHGDAQVERLKGSLTAWIEEMLAGPHDEAFFERQRRVGEVHVRYGVPPRYVFVTMAGLQNDLRCRYQDAVGPREALAFGASIERVASVGMATIMETYFQAHEEAELDALQGVLVSNMPTTVLLIDGEGRVASAAAPDTRLFEDRASIGMHYTKALPASLLDASALPRHVSRALGTGREVTLPRVDVEDSDGMRSFRIAIVPLQHARARALIHLGDLTDAIQAESRARQSETLAQLGAFSAGVAHELRNPLAGISGALQVMSRSFDAHDQRRSVMEKVNGQIRRLDEMVTDLLALAKPAEPVLTPIELRERASGVAEWMTREEAGVSVRIQGEGKAFADPALVDQILLNLLQNAATAMGGQGSITMSISDGRIAVRDSGPGVPPTQRRRIFEPFFTTHSRGTGLGLAICKRAAESMGADLGLVEGSPEGGACFVLHWSR